MADCSKTNIFLSEWDRCCNTYISTTGCSGCPIDHICESVHRMSCSGLSEIQKWSDEHPATKPKTYADVLLENFPDTLKLMDGKTPRLCRAFLCGDSAKKNKECVPFPDACIECWNETYTEHDENKAELPKE